MLFESSSALLRGRSAVLLMLFGFLSGALYAQTSAAVLPQVPSGTWAAAGQMSQARSGAASAVLNDGSLLVCGGTDAAGNVLATAEIYGADGSFQPAAPMQMARTGHTATWLSKGYVLVTGGAAAGGGILNSAELYDPLANTWTLLPGMLDARTGHTATPLPNGGVLLAGGENSTGPLASLEAFDLTTKTFSSAGTMSAARQAQAAAPLPDGRVLILGGTDTNGATLASSDIYDPDSGAVTPGPALNTPRFAATATTLLDGTVLIAGGSYPEGAAANRNIAELQTAEVFDPAAGTITPLASSLKQARSGQLAFLLPFNNSLLLAGGRYDGADLASAELYIPWTQAFSLTGTMETARSQAAGGALSPLATGLLLVAGGSGLAEAELYGFPTVMTDSTDYAPGSQVNITGSGWQPGETVNLYLRETPPVDNPPAMSAVADAHGKIANRAFAPSNQDVGVHFYLTAVGAASQGQAQTTFADSLAPFVSIDCEPDTLAVNNPMVCTFSAAPHGSCTPVDGTTITWTATNGTMSSPACTLSGLSCAVTYTPTGTVNPEIAATYPATPGCGSNTVWQPLTVQSSNPVPVTNGISPNNQNVNSPAFTITVIGANFETGSVVYFNGLPRATTYGNASQVTAAILSGDLANPGTFNVTVVNPGPGGGASNAQLFTVNQLTPALTITCTEVPYDGAAHSCYGAATGLAGAAVAGSFSFTPASEINAGSYPVTGTFISTDPNYVSGGTVSGTLIIDMVNQSPAVSCAGPLTYDGAAHGCTITGGFGACTSSTVTDVPGGAIALSCAGDANHNSWSGTGAVTINQAPSTTTITCPEAPYNGSPQTCTATVTPAGACTGLVAYTNAGSYPETATCTPASADYAPSSASGTLIIDWVSQSPSVSCPGPLTYDGAPHGCTITGGFGACTSATVIDVPGGAVALSCAGDNNHDPWSSSGSITINPAPSTTTVTCAEVTYNGLPQTCTATVTPAGACTGLVAYTNPGSYPETATCTPASADYAQSSSSGTLIIDMANQSPAVSCPGPLTYDGAPHGCTITGGFGACASATVTNVPGGSVALSCAGDAFHNSWSGAGSIVINPASSSTSVTCAGGAYNGLPQACTATVIPAGTCSGLVGYTSAGAYPEMATCTPTNPNYTQSSGSSTLVITSILSISPAAMAFSPQLVGLPSVAQYVILVNMGAAAAPVNGVVATGANPGDYVITDYSGTCSTGMVLPPKKECIVRVNFDPQAPGSSSAALVISSPAVTAGSAVAVSGTGIAPAPQVTVAPGSLTFNPQATGTSSAAQYVLVSSTGTAPLKVTGVVIAGANAGDFAVSDQAGTCVEGTTLVYNAKCNLRVVFRPSIAGLLTATLYIYDNVSGSPQTVALSGTGQVPVPTMLLSTQSLTFGPQFVGTSSLAQYVDIHNTGTVPLTVLGVSIVSGDASQFIISNQYGTCVTGMTLRPAQECDIRVVFDPNAPGTFGAQLLISVQAPAVSSVVQLSGTGQAADPQLTLSTAALSFAAQPVGNSSVAQYVLLSNTGPGPVKIAGVATSGGAAVDYSVTNQAGACIGGTTLVPGAKCNLRVVFAPTGKGSRQSSLVITDNTGNSPHVVTLNGTGD